MLNMLNIFTNYHKIHGTKKTGKNVKSTQSFPPSPHQPHGPRHVVLRHRRHGLLRRLRGRRRRRRTAQRGLGGGGPANVAEVPRPGLAGGFPKDGGKPWFFKKCFFWMWGWKVDISWYFMIFHVFFPGIYKLYKLIYSRSSCWIIYPLVN